jgi:BioD-like phosphotransacetylase family protein
VLEIPIIVVREDTYTVAKKMETLLMRHKLRDEIKIRQGAQLINANLDFAVLREQLGL